MWTAVVCGYHYAHIIHVFGYYSVHNSTPIPCLACAHGVPSRFQSSFGHFMSGRALGWSGWSGWSQCHLEPNLGPVRLHSLLRKKSHGSFSHGGAILTARFTFNPSHLSYHRIHRNDTLGSFFQFDDQMLDSLSRCIWGIQGIHLKLSFSMCLLSKNARLQSNCFNLSIPSHFPAFSIQDCGCIH